MLSRSDTLILPDPVMTLLPGQMGARGPERFTSHTIADILAKESSRRYRFLQKLVLMELRQ